MDCFKARSKVSQNSVRVGGVNGRALLSAPSVLKETRVGLFFLHNWTVIAQLKHILPSIK